MDRDLKAPRLDLSRRQDSRHNDRHAQLSTTQDSRPLALVFGITPGRAARPGARSVLQSRRAGSAGPDDEPALHGPVARGRAGKHGYRQIQRTGGETWPPTWEPGRLGLGGYSGRRRGVLIVSVSSGTSVGHWSALATIKLGVTLMVSDRTAARSEDLCHWPSSQKRPQYLRCVARRTPGLCATDRGRRNL